MARGDRDEQNAVLLKKEITHAYAVYGSSPFVYYRLTYLAFARHHPDAFWPVIFGTTPNSRTGSPWKRVEWRRTILRPDDVVLAWCGQEERTLEVERCMAYTPTVDDKFSITNSSHFRIGIVPPRLFLSLVIPGIRNAPVVVQSADLYLIGCEFNTEAIRFKERENLSTVDLSDDSATPWNAREG
uniref:Uncharacterized protein n=1 Tax=Moniliophthora roreri TaxID=221103 RepID=A0A0W0FYX8_MONRR